MAENLISVNNVSVNFDYQENFISKKQKIHAVNNINIQIKKGSFFGLVGESGSGKTTLGRAILGANKISSGNVIFHDDDRNYDLTDDGWGEHGNEWYKTGRKPDAPYQDYYRTCKMALRHHLYKISGDKYKSYIQPKEASGVRLKQTGPLRNIAVTGEGVVITHENFDEFDWSEYIPNL